MGAFHVEGKTYTLLFTFHSSNYSCSPPDDDPIAGSKLVALSRYRPEQAQRVDRGIALPFLDLGTRRGCVVSITPRPLYPRKRPGTHCTGEWVGPRAGLDV
jgi:hypothetical protein